MNTEEKGKARTQVEKGDFKLRQLENTEEDGERKDQNLVEERKF